MKIVGIFATVIGIAMMIGLGAMLFGDIQSTQVENSTVWNATAQATGGFEAFSGMILPMIMVVAAVFIIVIIIAAVKETKGGV